MLVDKKQLLNAVKVLSTLLTDTYLPDRVIRIENLGGVCTAIAAGFGPDSRIFGSVDLDVRDFDDTVYQFNLAELKKILTQCKSECVELRDTGISCDSSTYRTTQVDVVLPTIPETVSFEEETQDLSFTVPWGALNYARVATSTDPSRQNLNGVFIDTTNIVGTDGHRLHLTPQVMEIPQGDRPVWLANRFVNSLLVAAGRAGEITIEGYNSGWLRGRCGAVHVCMSRNTTAENGYPPYKRIIPSTSAYRFTVDAGEIRDILQPFKATIGLTVKLEFSESTLGIHFTETAKIPEFKSQVQIFGQQGEVPRFFVGVNPRYLYEALPKSGLVGIGFGKDNLSQISVENGCHMAIVMPFRL